MSSETRWIIQIYLFLREKKLSMQKQSNRLMEHGDNTKQEVHSTCMLMA